ncbi:hypothetical protein [Leisingera methylohalidivorans]|uniref:Uncharacterized protein n=1 Tax=Leisingera methylohalidivorans DSM 14336 TaxID=999552 RepID=V9W1X5_9RHOB|nr:hypothetical protein [Leisingera methylohalidivorans]AHD03177.1 hypothetical protein METH_15740 [Leisingera methylohalidivorans DSM 14336]
MMKGLFSKFRRKLAGSSDASAHPDLKPLSNSDFPDADYLPEATQAKVSSVPDEPAAAPPDVIESSLHPDLLVFEREFFATDIPANPRGEDPMRVNTPASGQNPSTTETFTKLEVENEVSGKEESDPDPGLAPPSPLPSSLSSEVELVEADDKYDELIDEDDEFAEPADELWEVALPYKFGEEIEGDSTHDASFDVTDFRAFPEFGSREVEKETENAQWEDLLDLDLFEEDPDLSSQIVEEETITDSHLLDEYAARLVSQMRIIKLAERALLQGRWKAVLEEFPFSSSFRALSRLVQAGISLGELEDACELKCLWRESPWLWSHRKFNRMQRAWEIDERSSYRSALSWKLALALVHRVGRAEAERKIFDDWRNEWLQMQPEQLSDGVRMDARFWSYPAFLNLDAECIELVDTETWYYEEPIDIQPSSSFRLEDSEGQIWRFEPKNGRWDTGFLSLLPHAKRVAAKEEAEAKEAGKNA